MNRAASHFLLSLNTQMEPRDKCLKNDSIDS